jgi:O-antigen ligase
MMIGASLLNRAIKVPCELFLFGLFILWSSLGLLVVHDISWFIRYYRLLVSILCLMFILVTVISFTRTPWWLYLSLLVYSISVLGYSILTGEVFKSYSYYSKSQMSGMLGNTNVFGFAMLIGIIAVAYFWKYAESYTLKCALISLTAGLVAGIIFSGSRQSFLCMIVFVALWYYFCYWNQVFRKLFPLIGLILLLSVLYFTFRFAVSYTYLGARLARVNTLENIAKNDRLKLYREGIDMVISYPVTGVGLGNFLFHSSSRLYAHSDLIEAASTTGILGFALYFSLYLVLWRRLQFLKRNTVVPYILYDLGLFKAIFLTMFLNGLTRPHFLQVDSMTLWAILIGYSDFLERQISIKHPPIHSDYPTYWKTSLHSPLQLETGIFSDTEIPEFHH